MNSNMFEWAYGGFNCEDVIAKELKEIEEEIEIERKLKEKENKNEEK